MRLLKLVRPERPVPNTRQNWNRPEDYERAMTAYYNALAIYEMLGGK